MVVWKQVACLTLSRELVYEIWYFFFQNLMWLTSLSRREIVGSLTIAIYM